MPNPRHNFDTHRCDSMPHGFSIRRYRDDGALPRWPEPGGWVLGTSRFDSEWYVDYLESVTPTAREHIRYCPWCGEEL